MFLCPSFPTATPFGLAGARATNFLGTSRGHNVQCEDCSRIGRKARAGARRPGSSASLLRLPPVPGRPVFPSCACIRVRPSGERVPRRCDRSESADSPAASRAGRSATICASPVAGPYLPRPGWSRRYAAQPHPRSRRRTSVAASAAAQAPRPLHGGRNGFEVGESRSGDRAPVPRPRPQPRRSQSRGQGRASPLRTGSRNLGPRGSSWQRQGAALRPQ